MGETVIPSLAPILRLSLALTLCAVSSARVVFDPLEAQRAKSPGGESSARGASPPTRQPSRPQIRITRDSSIAEVGDFLRQREDSGNKDESQSKKLAILQDAIQRSRQLDTKVTSLSAACVRCACMGWKKSHIPQKNFDNFRLPSRVL